MDHTADPSTAQADLPAVLPCPAWGASGCGWSDATLLAALTGAHAAWGARALWVAPDWSAPRGSRKREPGLDIVPNRQDCTVRHDARTPELQRRIDLAVSHVRARVANYDYSERSAVLTVDTTALADLIGPVEIAVRLAYGYVYILVVLRSAP